MMGASLICEILTLILKVQNYEYIAFETIVEPDLSEVFLY